jgi:tRNA uridine 5-carbamoylmethylation protein Kti12
MLNRKNYLIILTGLPASGKTTFAKTLEKIIEEQREFQVKIVDPDLIRYKLTGNQFRPELEQKVRRKSLKEVEKYLKQNYIVISDDLNYYTSMRHELKVIAEKLHLQYFIIHISTPREICLEWNKKRGKPIPDEVIIEISKKFDNFDNYEWDKPDKVYNLFKIRNEGDLKDSIKGLIEYIQEQPKKQKIRDLPIEKENIKEKADSITREIVGKILSNPNNRDKKEKLLQLRIEFVKNVAEGNLSEKEIEYSFKNYILKNSRIEV